MQLTKTREQLISTVPPNCIFAELGVFNGSFSERIKALLNPAKLYLVDIFDGVMGSGDVNGENFHFINLKESFEQLSNRYSSDPKTQVVKSSTIDFLNSISDGYLDAVYIDADHSYDAVRQDLNLSFLKVKENGLIMGHDYEENEFPGVVQAVAEFCKERNLVVSLRSEEKLPSFLIRKDSKH